MGLHLTLLTGIVLQKIASGLECGYPGEPANGTLVSTEVLFYPGEDVVYTCSDGFLLSGNNKRTCAEDGRWSGKIPACVENLALKKPATQSDVLWSYQPDLAVDGDPNTCSFTSRKEGQRWWQVSLSSHPNVDSVSITMSPGAYQKFAIFVVEIQDGNTAEYKPCAQFEGRFMEQQAKFVCNSGLGQTGQFVYIRDDRVDNEYFGLCEVQVFKKRDVPDCGRPENPVFGSVSLIETGQAAEYTCIQGYALSGNKVRNCTEYGWAGELPLCKEVTCDHPTSTKDGFIEVSNFRGSYIFGSRATYHCNPGFILWGNSTRVCDSNRQWTGLPPRCRPISCGDPPMLPHTAVSLLNGSTQWKSVALYSCLSGFADITDPNRRKASTQCREDGSWTHIQLECLTINSRDVVFSEQGEKNVFFVGNEGSRPAEENMISSGVITLIGILAAVILGTACLTTYLIIKKWLCKHIYFPAGTSLTGEKPLIYDKVENLVNNQGDVSSSPAAGNSCYQTTNLTTFGHISEHFSSPSSDNSILSESDKEELKRNPHFPFDGSNLMQINRAKSMYASLPRPKLKCYDNNELGETINHTQTQHWDYNRYVREGPQYANLQQLSDKRRHIVHYATLGRAPATTKLLEVDTRTNKSLTFESIPDILMTLSETNNGKTANVIVNDLSNVENLVDLSTPEDVNPPYFPNKPSKT